MLVNSTSNQTAFDIVLRHCGTIEALFDFLEMNGFNSLQLPVQNQVQVPSVLRPKVVQYFAKNGIDITTAELPSAGSFDNSFDNSFN